MNRVAQCLSCISLMFLFGAHSLNAANPATTTADLQQVQQLLSREAQPETAKIDRRQALNPSVRPETAANVAWWQAGFVKTADGWQSADSVSTAKSGMAILDEYRTKRSTAVKTVAGQMALADWCRSSKLPDQERAHLTQVLLLAPADFDGAQLYKRMGYRLVAGRWLTTADQRDLEASARRYQEHLREWATGVERISRNWNGNAKQRKLAQTELQGIDNPTAIPALVIASGRDESLAVAICEQLAMLPSFEASQALATIAVRSDSSAVRQAAAGKLKGRRIDDFAPALLAEMRSPFLANTSTGVGGKPMLMIREEADRYVAVDPVVVPLNAPAITIYYSWIRDRVVGVMPDRLTARRSNDLDRGLDDAREGLQIQIDDENDRAEEYNQRAAAVLAQVTCQELSLDPTYWWAWWSLYTGTQPIPKKCQLVRKGVYVPQEIRVVRCSCLTAGTPICTRQGFVAIDQIQVGDEVLSKNINTGEIDYRPVLQTTERQPVSVTKFVVAGSTITASEGHHFWVSGTGWSKTRELAAGQPIHTATGMSRIESAGPESQPASVYNLIVADFHTYFVGPGMILSHDVMQPSPTNVKVPGLDVD
ncbi:MAG: hypothetical protein JWP89_5641 [Schlesneria sp.]|nr:hypothetical protein [Schlesneria sp.]